MPFERIHNAPFVTFERLLRRVRAILKRYGRPDHLSEKCRGDYWIYDEHLWESGQVLFHVLDLKLLHPRVIRALRTQLRAFPGWEIVVVVDIVDHPEWPRMGLYIRNHEVMDGLLRDYFPPEYRDFRYEDARYGGIND